MYRIPECGSPRNHSFEAPKLRQARNGTRPGLIGSHICGEQRPEAPALAIPPDSPSSRARRRLTSATCCSECLEPRVQAFGALVYIAIALAQHVCVCVCVCVYVCIIFIYMHMYMYIYMYICICIYVYTHAHTHTHTHTHTCMYIQTYIHVYICPRHIGL
jgi:hypothetical protein